MYHDEPKNPLHIAQKQALADLIAQQTFDRFKEREGAFAAKGAAERLNTGPQLGNSFTAAEREEILMQKFRALEDRYNDVSKTLPVTEENFLLSILTKDQLINYIKYLKGQV